MKKIALIVACLFLGMSSRGQTNLKALDSIVTSAIQQNHFEGVVLVAEQGLPVYQKAAGFRDEAETLPNTPETIFGIASITKMMTAIVILELYEEGKLHLEDPLQKFLPELEIPHAEKITIHHLLLHISGLPNEALSVFESPKSPLEFVKETLAQGVINEPGSFNYANVDYVLLGLIIETLEGSNWENAVQQRIIDKLQLEHAGFLYHLTPPDGLASSFSFDSDGNRLKDPPRYIENYGSAGNMYSTAGDLLKIDQALHQNVLLKKATQDLMYVSYPEYNYTGYSVWTYNYPFLASQPRIMERRGGILGYSGVLVRFLDNNKTLIILSNNNQFNPDSFGNLQSLKEALIMVIGS